MEGRAKNIELLRNMWLFAECTEDELDQLATIAVRVDYPAGQVLAKEGEPERGFFIILDGSAAATRDGTVLALLKAGDFFGEMAILERDKQVATVTTVEPTEVLAMTDISFETTVTTMASVSTRMLIALARRIRALEARYLPLDQQIPRTAVGR